MNFVETSYLSDDEDGIELEDDKLYAHNIQSRLRNIIGSHILTCKTCQAMYKHVLGQQSILYSVMQTNRMVASPMYTSNDLMQLIKSKCKDKTACEIVKENNGGDESSKLVLTLRLGFGKKQHDDDIAEAYDFIEEDEATFLLQEPSPAKNIIFPASPFDHKKTAMSTKTIPLAIKDYITRCYTDCNSPLYHGFTNDMSNCFRDKAMFDKEILTIIFFLHLSPLSKNSRQLSKDLIQKSHLKGESLSLKVMALHQH